MKSIFHIVRWVLLVPVVLIGLSDCAQAGLFTLNWQQNFSQALNKTSLDWNIYDQAPFGSSQNTCFLASNTQVSKGYLRLAINTATNDCDRPYASAGLDTYVYHAQNYGRWVVRARFPAGYGVTGYIGLFAADGSWPPELDFGEVIGRQPTSMYMTQHWGVWPNDQQDTGVYTPTPAVDWTAGFHTYRIDWVPGTVKFYVDNVLVMTQPQNFSLPASGMKLAIGTGTGDCGSWVDCPGNAATNGFGPALPAEMDVDYVQIFSYAS